MLSAHIKVKKIQKFTDDLAEELYKLVTRKYLRRRVNVNAINKMWAADVIDMQLYCFQNITME